MLTNIGGTDLEQRPD